MSDIRLLPDEHRDAAADAEALEGDAGRARTVADYVAGMTDRYACRQALALLGWERDRLPVGIDV